MTRGRRALVTGLAGLIVLAGVAFLFWQGSTSHPENQRPGKFPEELVYVRSQDDVVNGGAIFTSSRASDKPIAIIWIHGWGANFYAPTYVGIARALAERGYTTITANTRMHDIGNVAKYSGERRVRGGGYWGVPGEQVRDIAAWTDFAERRGFRKVVLVGHSAGWAAVRRYAAETQDRRVVGVVLASGGVQRDPDRGTYDRALVAQATQLVAAGNGDVLLRLPNPSFPAYVSAAGFLDEVNLAPEYKDFFGARITNPGVMRLHCPLLALFGARETDFGNESDLRLIKSATRHQPNGPRSVDIVLIKNADHEYAGEEEQVAQSISQWADTRLP